MANLRDSSCGDIIEFTVREKQTPQEIIFTDTVILESTAFRTGRNKYLLFLNYLKYSITTGIDQDIHKPVCTLLVILCETKLGSRFRYIK